MSACCSNKHTSSSLFGIVQASRLQSPLYSGNTIYDVGVKTTNFLGTFDVFNFREQNKLSHKMTFEVILC